MGLKEATAEKHRQAEQTPFMQAVFKRKLPLDLWADFTYQKSLIYLAIESTADSLGLLKDIEDIKRAQYLYKDYMDMAGSVGKHPYRLAAIDYYKYIMSIYSDPDRIMAHLYVWHMGDLYGGQMIKKIVDAPHTNLDFTDPEKLKMIIRSKLNDNMADEANVAFDWAIKILSDYDVGNLEQH